MNKYQKRMKYVLRNANYLISKKQAKEIIYDDEKYKRFVEERKQAIKISINILRKIVPHLFTEDREKELKRRGLS